MRIAFEGSLSSLSPSARARLLDRRAQIAEGSGAGETDPEVGEVTGAPQTTREVQAILDRVRREGDAALVEMARIFDGVELDSIEVPRPRWREALATLDPEVREALERAAGNIERFHRAQLPPEATAAVELEIEPGVVLGRRAVPVSAAGVYAPGGRASYPSSVLMGVVPARAAGVGEVIVCSPSGPSGEPPPEILAASAIAGADRLFAVGGAGAIGAMAFGSETIPRVEAIVGPGNRWVTEAKRQVAGDVIIDSPAGPSEVLIVAEAHDGGDAFGGAATGAEAAGHISRRALLIALELIAQAEHDPDAAVLFVTDSPPLLASVRTALEREVGRCARRDVVEAAFAARGALLLADSRVEALEFAQLYAPEHLVLRTREPHRDLSRMTTSGTIFLGESTSVAFGDYMTGANHVLPTGGLARVHSGLSTLHFLRFFTFQEVTSVGAAALSGPTARLAEAEGLPGHAAAARAHGSAKQGDAGLTGNAEAPRGDAGATGKAGTPRGDAGPTGKAGAPRGEAGPPGKPRGDTDPTARAAAPRGAPPRGEPR